MSNDAAEMTDGLRRERREREKHRVWSFDDEQCLFCWCLSLVSKQSLLEPAWGKEGRKRESNMQSIDRQEATATAAWRVEARRAVPYRTLVTAAHSLLTSIDDWLLTFLFFVYILLSSSWCVLYIARLFLYLFLSLSHSTDRIKVWKWIRHFSSFSSNHQLQRVWKRKK